MKKLCSECKARFEVNFEDLEEGDAINCSECNLEYTVILKENGKPNLIESKKLEMEDEEETEEEAESEDYDHDSD